MILNLQYLVINGKELSAKILYQEYNAYLDGEIFKLTCFYGFTLY